MTINIPSAKAAAFEAECKRLGYKAVKLGESGDWTGYHYHGPKEVVKRFQPPSNLLQAAMDADWIVVDDDGTVTVKL